MPVPYLVQSSKNHLTSGGRRELQPTSCDVQQCGLVSKALVAKLACHGMFEVRRSAGFRETHCFQL